MTPLRASLLLGCLCLVACGKPAPIRVGFVGELTGNSADLGEASRNGVMLAIDQVNQRGGVDGRLIELVIRDTGTQADSARAAAQELVKSEVVAVIGTTTTVMTKAIMPTLEAAKVVQISPTASATDLYGKDDYLFRINWTTRDNAAVFAKAALAQGHKRVAGMLNQGNRAFSERWFADFSEIFKAGGGDISTTTLFESTGEHLPDQVATTLASQPDALIFVANAADSARLAQIVRKQHAHVPLMASEWAMTDQLIELGGRATEGLVSVAQFDRDDPTPVFVDFRQRYVKRFGREPAFASVLAHDAATVLVDALTRRQGNMPIKDALIQLGPFNGLQEPIQFNATGDTQRHVHITRIENGKYVRQP